MEITIDFSQMPTDNPLITAWYLFIHGGWIVFIIVLIWGGKEWWMGYIRTKFRSRWEWVILSIDVPKVHEQFPKAVEGVFAALAGTYKHIDWLENFFQGKQQVEFSFELVSRGGYLEFLIRTPKHYRDLVEAAVYAQYPDCEISEVPDYTEKYKGVHWPDHDNGYEIWGTKFKLMKKEYYPIRTWPLFFDDKRSGKDGSFKDVVYHMLEILSKLRQGEEFWFQVIVVPTDQKKWQSKAIAYAKKLLGQAGEHHGVWDALANFFLEIIDAVVYTFIGKPEAPEGKDEGPQYLKKEQTAIEGIQEKASKIGFKTTLRCVYIARKEVFNKNKVKEGFLGSLSQFTDLYSNGFYQDKYTKVSTSHLYYFPKYRVEHFRKNLILKKYLVRSTRYGSQYGKGFILNIEELASLWHFPVGDVKAVVLKKAEFKKAEAPFALPVEEATAAFEETVPLETEKGEEIVAPSIGSTEVSIEEDYSPPDDLPIE
jgi:hypothetical protein